MYMKKDKSDNIIVGGGPKDALEVHFPSGDGNLLTMIGMATVKDAEDFLPGFDFVHYDAARDNIKSVYRMASSVPR